MRIALIGDSLTSGAPGSSYSAILREQFPNDTLLNLGKANDTVVSLYRRLSRARVLEAWDLAFLWIGVNDVPDRDWGPVQLFSTLIGQRRARDMDEFRTFYRATLNLVCDNANHVIVAPPSLRGENLENPGNHRLEVPARLIQDLTADYEQVEFLDLRTIFSRELADRPISNHSPGNPLLVLMDVLTLRSDAQIDRKAAERGLHLTLDGIHLNSAGARIVAKELSRLIEIRCRACVVRQPAH